MRTPILAGFLFTNSISFIIPDCIQRPSTLLDAVPPVVRSFDVFAQHSLLCFFLLVILCFNSFPLIILAAVMIAEAPIN